MASSSIARPIEYTIVMFLTRLARGLLGGVGDLCYPGGCAVCDRFCDGSGPLCPSCAEQLIALADEPACERCAKPVATHGSPCPWCLGKGIHPYKTIVRLGEYAEPLRLLIQQVKYHRQWPLGEILGDWLWRQQRVRDLLQRSPHIVAVPLHLFRHVWRGYNQSGIVARRLAQLSGVKVIRPLVRIRNTETQTHLRSQQARYENVRGAFALLNARAVRGRHIVVIDDVMTTGSTLRAVARTLRQAKPASLSAIVLAVADPKRRDFQAI